MRCYRHLHQAELAAVAGKPADPGPVGGSPRGTRPSTSLLRRSVQLHVPLHPWHLALCRAAASCQVQEKGNGTTASLLSGTSDRAHTLACLSRNIQSAGKLMLLAATDK